MSHKDPQEFRHESYGMVGFTRYTTTNQRLFGSAIKTDSVISLHIARCVRKHDLHQDWFTDDSVPLIEVHMTELQFAQLLTSLNVGHGVPCTIGSLNGKRIPDPPQEVRSSAELNHDHLKQKVSQLDKTLEKSRAEISTALANTKMAQRDRANIEQAIDFFMAEVSENLPFLMDQFQESTDEIITSLKAEVVAFTERALKAAGLEHIKQSVPQIDWKK